jgi:HSP20 family protein
LQDEINRIFSNARDGASSSATVDWSHLVEINEYLDRFELFIDLPGVDPKSLEITLDNDVLTLSGERSIPRRAGEKYQVMRQRSERRHGRYHRRFILPETVDTDRVTGKGRDRCSRAHHRQASESAAAADLDRPIPWYRLNHWRRRGASFRPLPVFVNATSSSAPREPISARFQASGLPWGKSARRPRGRAAAPPVRPYRSPEPMR